MSLGPYWVVFFRSSRGECFAEDFLQGLPGKARGKMLRWIAALETQGPDLPRPYADSVRGKIRELRMVFGSVQYRLLYFIVDKQVVITHGFIKKTGSVPVRELERAERLMDEWHSQNEGPGNR